MIFAVIAVCIGAGFLFLLASEKNRRKCRVFLYKHFYRHKYDYREEWLKFTSHISRVKNFDALQTAILTYYCDTFARTGAALFLYDHDGCCYRRSSTLSLDLGIDLLPARSALVQSLSGTDRIYSTFDRHEGELEEVDALLRTYHVDLCIPLRFEESLGGFVCLGQAVNSNETLTYEDYDLMRVLASQATAALMSMRLAAQLSSSQEMAAIGKVATFIVHDLKNHVTSLSLVLANAHDYIDDKDFQKEMLDSLSDALMKMKNLILSLQKIGSKHTLRLAECDLLAVVRRGAAAVGLPAGIVHGKPVKLRIDREEIEKVIINLLINARESGSPDEELAVTVGSDSEPFFTVIDQGCGMSEEFIRNDLFRPFKTTKPKGFGVGLYQCRQIVEAHGGRIDVQSTIGQGTAFRVTLPLATTIPQSGD